MTATTTRTRPTIFADWQARAAHAGRLTQFRVPMKDRAPMGVLSTRVDDDGFLWWSTCPGHENRGGKRLPFAVGDVVTVKEAWQTHCDLDHLSPSAVPVGSAVQYPAMYGHWAGKRRSAAHMPAWVARFAFTVKAVGVERCNAITEDDARACGCDGGVSSGGGPSSCQTEFCCVWSERHGPASWDAGHWCEVVRVEKCEVPK